VPPETEETIQKMLLFSFSRALNSHASFVRLLTQSFCIAVKYFSSKPQTVWTMRAVLNYISTHINFRILSVNRKNEELLAFETIAMYAFMQTEDAKKISISMEDFDQKYPEFTAPGIVGDEKRILFEFCNCTRFVQCLIPAHNNKEHILDLVCRLVEGFSVKRVTGTGMTKETFRRYSIIHREGNLMITPRPGRRVDPKDRAPKVPRKRGRPLSLRDDGMLVAAVSVSDLVSVSDH
jgi:hypothetical protein